MAELPLLSPWGISQPKMALVAGVADMVASNDSWAELVTYSPGSCLGVTVYDPVGKVGGLLHLMLSDSSIDSAKAATAPFMFVDTEVPRLFAVVYDLGGQRSRVVVKVAGGAHLLDPQKRFNIGERNFQARTSLLARNGHGLSAHDVGGLSSRTLRFDLTTGQVSIHSPGQPPYLL